MSISTPDVSSSLLIALVRAAIDSNIEQEPAWQAESIRLRRVTGHTAADDSLIHYLEERLSTGIPSVQLVVATAEALLDAGHSQLALDVPHS